MRRTRSAAAEPSSEADPEEVLNSSPFEQDVQEALDDAPKERPRPSLTLVLVGAILLAAGFLGGVKAHEQWGTGSGGGVPSAAGARGAMPGGYGGYGMPGGGGRAGGAPGGLGGGATVGTVKLVSGGTVYVQTADGSVVPVETSGSTRIRISRTGKLSDLEPGSTIAVQGTGDASGKVAATTITEGGTGLGTGTAGRQPGGN